MYGSWLKRLSSKNVRARRCDVDDDVVGEIWAVSVGWCESVRINRLVQSSEINFEINDYL